MQKLGTSKATRYACKALFNHDSAGLRGLFAVDEREHQNFVPERDERRREKLVHQDDPHFISSVQADQARITDRE